jgi:hypothetical protein
MRSWAQNLIRQKEWARAQKLCVKKVPHMPASSIVAELECLKPGLIDRRIKDRCGDTKLGNAEANRGTY